MIRRHMVSAGLVAAAATALGAQAPSPGVVVARGERRIEFVVTGELPARAAIRVEKATASGEWRPFIAEPLVAERNMYQLAERLGASYALAEQVTRGIDTIEVTRRLMAESRLASMASMLDTTIARVMGRRVVDTMVTPGSTVRYRLTVLGVDGQPVGAPRIVSVLAASPAAAVATRLTAKAGRGRVQLTWQPPPYRPDSGDGTVAYVVYRAAGTAAPVRIGAMPVARLIGREGEFTDGDVAVGGRYRYVVRGLDVAGRLGAPSAPAEVIVADRTPPSAPADLSVRDGIGRVELAWMLPLESDVAGWHVERSRYQKGRFERLTRALVPVGDPAFVDSTPPGGTLLFYRVIAVDSAGNASNPSTALQALPRDASPPDSVRGFTVTVRGRRIVAQWQASPSPDVAGYAVYRRTAEIEPVRLTPSRFTALTYVDSGVGGRGLRAGESYELSVRAIDASGNLSEPVVRSARLADDEAPRPPTGVRAERAPTGFVEVRWSPSPSLDVREYRLTRLPSAGDTVHIAAAAALAWRDTAVALGRRYAYRVFAVDSVGNRSPAAVDSLLVEEREPPAAPRRVLVDPAEGPVVVRWERVVDDRLVGYHVYRGASENGRFVRVTSVPVTGLAWTDPAPTRGAWYLVRAVDAAGNESLPSPSTSKGVP